MSDKCTCNEDWEEGHTCPFKTEINDDYDSLCHCCEYCTSQCSDDI